MGRRNALPFISLSQDAFPAFPTPARSLRFIPNLIESSAGDRNTTKANAGSAPPAGCRPYVLDANIKSNLPGSCALSVLCFLRSKVSRKPSYGGNLPSSQREHYEAVIWICFLSVSQDLASFVLHFRSETLLIRQCFLLSVRHDRKRDFKIEAYPSMCP